MNNIIGIIVSIIYIGMILVSSKVFEKNGKEASRKYTHIMLSNWWIIAMIFFDNWIWASIMPLAFVFINFFSYKYNIIKVMERDVGDENKDSLGTVYYAISLFVLAIITFGIINNPAIGLCGIIVMGYGDGLAAVVGQAVKSKQFRINGNKKSVAGCLAMFLVTFMIIAGYLTYIGSSAIFIKAICVAIFMTIVEAISIKGTDNITVPIITSLLMLILA
ncbi:MAG: SEC59/DGK1/VTE5 family protein [bacterium]|nr:SEC59/DGK1/VTE5 family protein [bacterium]